MKISLIIPTYNRKRTFETGLQYALNQKLSSNVSLEIIVIDDGSTDNTRDIVIKYQKDYANLLYFYKPRTSKSSRSAARNLGITKSTGDIISFLDSGMLVPNNYVQLIYEAYKNSSSPEKMILLHYVYGLYRDLDDKAQKFIDKITPENIDDLQTEIKNEPNWQDRRALIFQAVDNDSKQLPGAWVLGWGGVLTVSKTLLGKSGNFDETFLRWGGEDSELSYRLHTMGGLFNFITDSYAIHLPHKMESSPEKMKSSMENRLKIHRKFGNFETELYTVCQSLHYNQIFLHFKFLSSSVEFPESYSEQDFCFLNDILETENKSALIGVDNFVLANKFNVTDYFVSNKSGYDKLVNELQNRKVHYLLGISTLFDDNFFDTLIITDFIRHLSPRMQYNLVKESYRISEKVYMLYTPNYISPLKYNLNMGWSNIEDLEKIGDKLELQFVKVKSSSTTEVYNLVLNYNWY